MAEFARWQWDDIGTWRDFAEQYQAQMEAGFTRRDKSVEIAIPPFGTFKMDLGNMTQVTIEGRNPGYERGIRRQAKKIELGYFLLGFEGEIFASDSAVDNIEEESVLEALVQALRRVLDEPEEFSHRSLSLLSDEYRDTIGKSKVAQEFLAERGFETIQEGSERFLVFMQEQVDGLGEARKEVEASLGRLQKKGGGNSVVECNSVAESVGIESNAVVDAGQLDDQIIPDASEAQPGSSPGPPCISLPGRHRLSNIQGCEGDIQPASCEISVVLPSGRECILKLTGNATLEELLNAVKDAVPGLRLPLLKAASTKDQSGKDGAEDGEGGEEKNAPSKADETTKEGKSKRSRKDGKGGKGKGKSGKGGRGGGGAVEAMVAAMNAESASHQSHGGKGGYAGGSPAARSAEPGRSPTLDLALAAEPGMLLHFACPERLTLRCSQGNVISRADPESGAFAMTPATSSSASKPSRAVIVEDFEGTFVERLQSGLLRLKDLAAVSPLLDWEKPELLRLLMGRMRSLLEGSCDAWCKAAETEPEEELLCGRALLRHVYGQRSLDARLRICRDLLPAEKRDSKIRLKVDREEDFLPNALGGLLALSLEELRNPLEVNFKGEVAEDHGGPRRDFFGLLGTRLTGDLLKLWRRLPQGVLAPVPDLVAEASPKEARGAYRACGRACGLAAKYGDVLGEEFAGFFLHQVARDDTVGLKELQQQLSEAEGSHDVRASSKLLSRTLTETGMVGLTLSRTITGTLQEVDLVPGGRNLPVTEENKALWLRLHLHDKLYGSLRKAADAFRQGVLDVFGGSRRTCPILVLLTPAELARIWAGSSVSDQDVHRWREVATVSGEVSKQAAWLWEILLEADEEFRGNVLKFSTGVHRLGHAGLQSFEVQPADGEDESLPRAMTCANMLQLPRYSSKESLHRQLLKATQLCDGFQIL
ncbi:unnamed protein product [Polarella glacialis]|uniref:HECT-type E3 ubiquitin transferase n=1 Tax=Polarella glacialis TaxID=89957 RepID=A0A813FAZ0_POLGL|nr:unnamed protein product [Polarella glacialis]